MLLCVVVMRAHGTTSEKRRGASEGTSPQWNSSESFSLVLMVLITSEGFSYFTTNQVGHRWIQLCDFITPLEQWMAVMLIQGFCSLSAGGDSHCSSFSYKSYSDLKATDFWDMGQDVLDLPLDCKEKVTVCLFYIYLNHFK